MAAFNAQHSTAQHVCGRRLTLSPKLLSVLPPPAASTYKVTDVQQASPKHTAAAIKHVNLGQTYTVKRGHHGHTYIVKRVKHTPSLLPGRVQSSAPGF
jgi:hypothetical protein